MFHGHSCNNKVCYREGSLIVSDLFCERHFNSRRRGTIWPLGGEERDCQLRDMDTQKRTVPMIPEQYNFPLISPSGMTTSQ